nr:hypothetical protein [uncultured Romboutsia sp.]
MRKYKLKYLTLILALCIVSNSFDIFADTPNNQGNSSTILDGEIGEWDPSINDKPDFSDFNDADLEGSKPTEGQYFTISATVPISMEFMVLPSSYSKLGSFFSPTYKIKNNGSKTLVVKLASFNEDTSKPIDEEKHAKLFIEKVKNYDERTQMELKLGTLDDTYWYDFSKEVDLTKINSLNDEEKILCELSMNQEKNIKFNSEKWERPENEVLKKSAMSNFTATFEFAIKEP